MLSTADTGTVLLTRPLADAQRFASLLPEVRVMIAPILRIAPVDHDVARLAAAAGLVFTSAHAVPAAGAGRGRLALCVGAHTAEVARQAGFDVVEGSGDAKGLLRLIDASPVPLVYPHGRHVSQVLPVEGMVVYDQVPQPLSQAALQVLAASAPVVMPLFSARSARLLSMAIGADVTAPLRLAAISAAALAGWTGPSAPSRLAEQPNAKGMVNAVTYLLSREQ